VAKLNTTRAHEVAAITVTEGMRFALRSDRVILRRFTGDLATGYSHFGKVKPSAELNAATLRRIVVALGYHPKS